MGAIIGLLLVILLLITIFAVWRVIPLLTQAKETLQGFAETKVRLDSTIQHVNVTLGAVHTLIDEQITPTVESARVVLHNMQVTTLGLADATQSVRELSIKAESVGKATRMIAAGGAVVRTFLSLRSGLKPSKDVKDRSAKGTSKVKRISE